MASICIYQWWLNQHWITHNNSKIFFSTTFFHLFSWTSAPGSASTTPPSKAAAPPPRPRPPPRRRRRPCRRRWSGRRGPRWRRSRCNVWVGEPGGAVLVKSWKIWWGSKCAMSQVFHFFFQKMDWCLMHKSETTRRACSLLSSKALTGQDCWMACGQQPGSPMTTPPNFQVVIRNSTCFLFGNSGVVKNNLTILSDLENDFLNTLFHKKGRVSVLSAAWAMRAVESRGPDVFAELVYRVPFELQKKPWSLPTKIPWNDVVIGCHWWVLQFSSDGHPLRCVASGTRPLPWRSVRTWSTSDVPIGSFGSWLQ